MTKRQPDSDALLRATFDLSPIGIAVLSPDGRFVRANSAIGDLFGISTSQLTTMHLSDVIPANHVDCLLLKSEASRAHDLPTCQIETRLSSGLGLERWAMLTSSQMLDIEGENSGIVVHALDVTERRSREEQLRYQSLHDPLTSLLNRTGFAERLGRALAGVAAHGSPLAVMLLDLDDFKSVNERFGRTVGDKVLSTIANRLAAALRAGDLAARVGEDEFALLIGRARTRAEAETVAGRVLEVVRTPIVIGDRAISVTGSLGVSIASGPVDAGDLMRFADLALGDARAGAKGSFAIGTGPLQDREAASELRHLTLSAD